MRALVRAVTGPEAARGLALAGLAPIVVHDAEQAGAALSQLARESDRGGVVLVEQSLLDGLSRSLRRQIERDGAPVLVGFPGPALAVRRASEEDVLEILRQAIGYRVRLR